MAERDVPFQGADKTRLMLWTSERLIKLLGAYRNSFIEVFYFQSSGVEVFTPKRAPQLCEVMPSL